MISSEWIQAIAAAEAVTEEEVIGRAAGLEAKIAALIQEGKEIFPPRESIFCACELTPPGRVRAVILGQDPYHDDGQATGLAFSVPADVKLPPSLRNIFRELSDDLGCPMPASGDLTPWAERGVLLLNTTLTVEAHRPASHAKLGWSDLTRGILLACMKQPRPAVFLLWGSHAQKAADEAAGLMPEPERERMLNNKLFLRSVHPSPLSARRGFFGSRPFSRANDFLTAHGAEPVDWTL